MDMNKKYAILVGTKSIALGNYDVINSWYKDTADSISELLSNLKEYYKKSGTTWEEKPFEVRVYRLIHEDNGYVHCSKTPYLSTTTEDFWLK